MTAGEIAPVKRSAPQDLEVRNQAGGLTMENAQTMGRRVAVEEGGANPCRLAGRTIEPGRVYEVHVASGQLHPALSGPVDEVPSGVIEPHRFAVVRLPSAAPRDGQMPRMMPQRPAAACVRSLDRVAIVFCRPVSR